MPTKICVYAICKNEEKYVDKWFHNVLPADYIAVLDTGSKPEFYDHLLMIQRTVNEAVGYQKIILAQKEIKPWRFDVARNESMKLIPADTDLCLCTDFDELLCDNWADIMRATWQGQSRVMYQYAWTHTATGEPAKIFTYDKCHANDGKHFWKYPVHEVITLGTMEQDLEEIRQGCYINDPMPFLEHFPDPEKQRQASYRELLKIRAEEFPDEAFSYTYWIGQLYWEKKYQELLDYAINKALPVLMPMKDKDQATMSDTYTYIGDSYRAIGDLKHAAEFHQMCIAFLPEMRDGYINYGLDLIYMGRTQEGIDQVHKGLRVSKHMHIWSEREFGWTYMPYIVLALGYKLLGCNEVADDYNRLADSLGAPQGLFTNLLSDFKPATLK